MNENHAESRASDARTSLTHPLRIDAVIVPGTGGAIGMTICPGKKQANAMSGAHDRDLGLDLAAIRDWGAEILVSLIEEREYGAVGIANFVGLIPAGMVHLRLPIPDAGLPDASWERRWDVEGRRIRAVLRRGGKVCVHCMGGLGRTGTVAARLLVEFGMHPRGAVADVRAARPGAIETDEQLRYVLDLEPIWKRYDRARGCLVGGACGDALGAPVEFLARGEILARFGPGGILEFDAGGLITDDTQMSLFTAEGLIRAELHGRPRGTTDGRSCDPAGFAGFLHHAYLRWLATQGEYVPFADFRPDGWLYAVPELHALRAPGKTCLDALRASAGIFTPIRAINDRKGCGGVMRAAPVGVFTSAAGTRRDAFELGIVSGRITHGHPSGYLGAGALACIIHDLMRGAALPDSIDAALALLRPEPGSGETVAALEKAVDLARRVGDPVRDIAALGEGWVGEEALSIGVYCAMRASSCEEGIRMAVNITGDSDSTGAIAGNILGALHGLSAIPARWREAVELGPVVQAVADDLLAIRDLPPDPDARAMNWWTARYPGW